LKRTIEKGIKNVKNLISECYQQKFSNQISTEYQKVKIVIHTYQHPVDNFYKDICGKVQKSSEHKKDTN